MCIVGIVHAELSAVEDKDGIADGGEVDWAGDVRCEEDGGGNVFDYEYGGGGVVGVVGERLMKEEVREERETGEDCGRGMG